MHMNQNETKAETRSFMRMNQESNQITGCQTHQSEVKQKPKIHITYQIHREIGPSKNQICMHTHESRRRMWQISVYVCDPRRSKDRILMQIIWSKWMPMETTNWSHGHIGTLIKNIYKWAIIRTKSSIYVAKMESWQNPRITYILINMKSYRGGWTTTHVD